MRVEFFDCFSSYCSSLFSLSFSLDSKINSASNINLMKLNSDFEQENIKLKGSGLHVLDQYWDLLQIIK